MKDEKRTVVRSQRSEDGRRPGEMHYDVFYEKFHWVKKTKEEGRGKMDENRTQKSRRLVKKMKLNCGAERHHYSTFDVQCSMLDVHFLAAESELPQAKRSSLRAVSSYELEANLKPNAAESECRRRRFVVPHPIEVYPPLQGDPPSGA